MTLHFKMRHCDMVGMESSHSCENFPLLFTCLVTHFILVLYRRYIHSLEGEKNTKNKHISCKIKRRKKNCEKITMKVM